MMACHLITIIFEVLKVNLPYITMQLMSLLQNFHLFKFSFDILQRIFFMHTSEFPILEMCLELNILNFRGKESGKCYRFLFGEKEILVRKLNFLIQSAYVLRQTWIVTFNKLLEFSSGTLQVWRNAKFAISEPFYGICMVFKRLLFG